MKVSLFKNIYWTPQRMFRKRFIVKPHYTLSEGDFDTGLEHVLQFSCFDYQEFNSPKFVNMIWQMEISGVEM